MVTDEQVIAHLEGWLEGLTPEQRATYKFVTMDYELSPDEYVAEAKRKTAIGRSIIEKERKLLEARGL